MQRSSRARCVWIHIVFNLQFIFIANALNENLPFIFFFSFPCRNFACVIIRIWIMCNACFVVIVDVVFSVFVSFEGSKAMRCLCVWEWVSSAFIFVLNCCSGYLHKFYARDIVSPAHRVRTESVNHSALARSYGTIVAPIVIFYLLFAFTCIKSPSVASQIWDAPRVHIVGILLLRLLYMRVAYSI